MKIADQADVFDVSVSSINKWGGEGYPIKGTLKDQVRWVRQYRPLPSDVTLAGVRKEKIQVETELRKLELLIRQGELIRRSEVVELFADRLLIIRNGLLSLHRVLPPKLQGRDYSEFAPITKRVATELLERYSRRSGPLLKGGK